jgi:hypothetical protein
MKEDGAMSLEQAIHPVPGPAAWYGRELARRDEWIYRLSRAETDEVLRLVAALRGMPRDGIGAADVPLDALAPALQSWRETLRYGRGFVLIRGLPLERMSSEDAALAYWALGQHLGTPAPQNFLGETLVDIRDTGADPTDPSTRLYKTRAEQDFHTTEPTSSGSSVSARRSPAAQAASSAR